jgi:methylmalonyl-CoA mutase N-terminal domain/subunit
VVGVNALEVKESLELERVRVDPTIEAGQKARLAALREKRDTLKVSELTAQLASAARSRQNLMPLFVTCVENLMTLGEICNVLRNTWGEYQPPAWI